VKAVSGVSGSKLCERRTDSAAKTRRKTTIQPFFAKKKSNFETAQLKKPQAVTLTAVRTILTKYLHYIICNQARTRPERLLNAAKNANPDLCELYSSSTALYKTAFFCQEAAGGSLLSGNVKLSRVFF
jgi:hypothetical protein